MTGSAETPTFRALRFQAHSKEAPLDVLVIGAGLSGLESALLLDDLGARVQVIEARQRVGGRICTLFDRPGHPEVGGNTCAAGYGRMLNRINTSGLTLFDVSTRLVKNPGVELALGSRILTREECATSPLNPLPEKSRSSMPWEFSAGFLSANNPLKNFDEWLARWSETNVPGVLLTSLLLSLGAPFWSSALKRMLQLRSVVAARDDEQLHRTGGVTYSPFEAVLYRTTSGESREKIEYSNMRKYILTGWCRPAMVRTLQDLPTRRSTARGGTPCRSASAFSMTRPAC